MVDIQRTEPDFARISCDPTEWEYIQFIVNHSVEHYHSTVLDYLIPGDALDRFEHLKRFNADLQSLPNPMQVFHKADIRLLLIVVEEFHRKLDQGQDPGLEKVMQRLMKFHYFNIFG